MSGNIRVKNVSLNCLFGDATDLLDRITCDKLTINSMSLSIDETRCLTEMLNSRVRMLTLKQSTVKTLEKSFLTKYDGEGHCQCIQYECYVGNENQIYWKNEVKEMFQMIKTWANSKAWIVTHDEISDGWTVVNEELEYVSQDCSLDIHHKFWMKIFQTYVLFDTKEKMSTKSHLLLPVCICTNRFILHIISVSRPYAK